MTQILARKKHGIPNGSRLVDVLIVITVAVICLFTLYPMYYVFIMSISKPQDVLAMNVSFWPTGFELRPIKKSLPIPICGVPTEIPSCIQCPPRCW